jgi:hypothetical protein
MRTTNRGLVGAVVVLIATVAACSTAAAPTAPPTPAPTPLVTPDPHLADPAAADVVYRALVAAGLRVTANTASSSPGREPVKQINATLGSWPLIVSEFSTSAALRKAVTFDPRKGPGRGDAAFALAGLNILVEYGPKATNVVPKAVPAERLNDAEALGRALDRLLGPLSQRSVQPLPLPTAPPAASATASARP